MNKISYFLISILFLLSFTTLSQDEIKKTIKLQAEKIVTSVFEKEYDTLIKYTHPRLIELAGGKDVLMGIIKSEMKAIEEQGLIIEKVEIGDSILLGKHKKEYHTLVPKVMIFRIQGKRILSKSYLFGFSSDKGKNWTFIEADKLQSEKGALILPNFKTSIKIPKQPDPIFLED